jgi:drug/metabolite transporter (DMT)-like permease
LCCQTGRPGLAAAAAWTSARRDDVPQRRNGGSSDVAAGRTVMTSQAPAASGKTALRGIACMLVATACFATMDSLVKWVAPRIPVMQIVFFRSLFAFIPIALLIARDGGIATLRTRRLGDHAKRSLCGVVSLACFIYAFGHMPLADAVAIGFSAPLFITALSVPLLGESVGIRRWSAVLVGFVGVIVMVRPGGGVFDVAAVVALVATMLYALAMIFIRSLGRSESTGAIAFYYTLLSTLAGAAFLPFQWVAPTPVDALLLVAIGLVGGCGQLLITSAFRNAPAAVIAPFDYISMLYVSLIGYAVWGDVPDRFLLAGAAIVIASGLYILNRETRRGAGPQKSG